MTLQALQALAEVAVIVGYKVYVELISDLLENKEVHSTGMGREVDRCRLAIEKAQGGQSVALISSGDCGIYGMAGLVYELVENDGFSGQFEIEIIPGITAATAGAALLGAPLMNDWASISLSNALTPWEVIVKRLHAAGQGDFVIALYNPRSRARPRNLAEAVEILHNYRAADTPVGIVRNAYRENQDHYLTTLGEINEEDVDMFTTVIIGNSLTRNLHGHLVTLRGYPL